MESIREAREDFIDRVYIACEETKEFSKDVANAIGEISVDEAKTAILKLFEERLNQELFIGRFNARQTKESVGTRDRKVADKR